MNAQRYRWILYTIVIVIIATIGIQIYWNYKNYQTNKRQLINDVQISLDKAVDDYYANLAEETTVGFDLKGSAQQNIFEDGSAINNILENIDENDKKFTNLDSFKIDEIEGITILRGRAVDSMMERDRKENPRISADSLKKQIEELRQTKKDLNLSNIQMLTSKIVISIKNDTLDIRKLDSMLNFELQRKKIDVDYKLDYKENLNNYNIEIVDSSFIENSKGLEKKFELHTISKSNFLPENSELSIVFTNETKVILRRILGGILISIILVFAVISCLFYLLNVIKRQKELAEIKNDLINNITHEFKTPIATIGVALESISNFNAIDDKEKTKKYIHMSSEQLGKLNIMVEKLLETATLDSESLELNKETIDIVELLESLAKRYKIQYQDKKFNTSFKTSSLMANVDVFHFENALNNILDNAVKYGGDIISMDVFPKNDSFDILISDNGNSLSKANKARIFEKFYRVPKGNTHDVKGFGIGLYYTKTIIEKHNGSIDLDLNDNLTTFKINLPNG